MYNRNTVKRENSDTHDDKLNIYNNLIEKIKTCIV